jgi:hypothetical protein
MSIDDAIFAKLPGESEEDYAARLSVLERPFRNVLANAEGHKLVHLLVSIVNPTYPRFSAGVSSEMAAFRDGQADVIATLLRRGTNLGISQPNDL